MEDDGNPQVELAETCGIFTAKEDPEVKFLEPTNGHLQAT
jgi:hypothetical protein